MSSILHPRPINFKFYKHSMKFVAALSVLGECPPAPHSASDPQGPMPNPAEPWLSPQLSLAPSTASSSSAASR